MPRTKQSLIDAAEVIDAWRLLPRAFVIGYGWLAWDVHQWVKSLPDISTQQGAYAGAIVGLCVPLLGWYFHSGRKWQ